MNCFVFLIINRQLNAPMSWGLHVNVSKHNKLIFQVIDK